MSQIPAPMATVAVILFWMLTIIAGILLIRMIFLTKDHDGFLAISVLYLSMMAIKLFCGVVLSTASQPVTQFLITDITGLVGYLILLILTVTRTRN